MATAKVAITIEESLLKQVDRLVSSRVYPSRSRAIQDAVADKLQRMDRRRLARECAKLDPAFEQAMAEEGMGSEVDSKVRSCRNSPGRRSAKSGPFPSIASRRRLARRPPRSWTRLWTGSMN